MIDFESADDFHQPMHEKVRNLAGRTESQHHNPTNIPPGALIRADSTASKMLKANIDPRLLSLSKAKGTCPRSSNTPSRTEKSPSRLQLKRDSAHRLGAHDRKTSRVKKSMTRNPTPHVSARSDDTKGQKFKPSHQRLHRRVSNSDASNHGLRLQSQSQKKNQGKSHAWRDKAAKSTAVGPLAELADPDSESDSTVRSDNRIRWMDGVMEWLDDKDLQWRPARYHHDCRAELITLAAQQPGAPVWTEHMGTDYTSFSPLIQGWTKDPASVLDSKGRQVLLMEKYPSDWIYVPVYGYLFHNGLLLLSHENRPIRDIPGLPLTINSGAYGWFLEGLRRCSCIEMKDLIARFPGTWQTKSGYKKPQGASTLRQRIGRWLVAKGIEPRDPRPGARKAKQRFAAKHDAREPEVGRTQHQPPAELEVGLGEKHTHLSNSEPPLPAEISDGQASNYDSPWVGAGTYASVNEDASPVLLETSALGNFGGHADTGHLPISQCYSSDSGCQLMPAYSNCRFEGENDDMQQVLGGSSFDHETPQWDYNILSDMLSPLNGFGDIPRADNHSSVPYSLHHYGFQSTASPVLSMPDLDCNQTYNLGYQSTYPEPMDAIFPNTAYSPDFVPEFLTQDPEISSQPQSYNSQTYPTSTPTDTNHFFTQISTATDAMDATVPNTTYSPFVAPEFSTRCLKSPSQPQS